MLAPPKQLWASDTGASSSFYTINVNYKGGNAHPGRLFAASSWATARGKRDLPLTPAGPVRRAVAHLRRLPDGR